MRRSSPTLLAALFVATLVIGCGGAGPAPTEPYGGAAPAGGDDPARPPAPRASGLPELTPPSLWVEPAPVAGEPEQRHCEPDATRDRVAIVVRAGGAHDTPETAKVMLTYLVAVNRHLGVGNAGIWQLGGAADRTSLEHLVDSLVRDRGVGYLILVGVDLPIVDAPDASRVLATEWITGTLAHVGRAPGADGGCVDLAISAVAAPAALDAAGRRAFVEQAFARFAAYHEAPEQTFAAAGERTLVVGWDDALTELGAPIDGAGVDPAAQPEHRRRVFGDYDFLLSSDLEALATAYDRSHRALVYRLRGAPSALGLGLGRRILSSPQQVVDHFAERETAPFLLVHVDRAEGQKVVVDPGREDSVCCWPQAWLQTGAWAMLDVRGDPDHLSFDRHLHAAQGRTVGAALRRTFHKDALIVGDVLASAR